MGRPRELDLTARDKGTMSNVMEAPPDESTTGKHVPALDGVRGLALLIVMARHLLARPHASDSAWASRLVYNAIETGWIGVDLFFALSGFLITGILYDTLNDPHFFRNFYARRVLRIFPLYYGFFAALVLLGVLGGHAVQWSRLLPDLLNVANLSHEPPEFVAAPWLFLGHLWSLNMEEQFYVVWPLLVFVLRSRLRILWTAVGVCAGLAVFRSLVQLTGMVHNVNVYTWTPTHLDGLLLGAALAMLMRGPERAAVLRWSPAVMGAGVVALGFVFLKFHGFSPNNAWISTGGYTVLALTACGLIGWALRRDSVCARVLQVRPMRTLGRYSYSMYLIHPMLRDPILEPAYRGIQRTTHSSGLAFAGSFLWLLMILTGMGALIFRFYEMPFLRLKRFFHAVSPTPRLRRDVADANAELARPPAA